MKVRLNYPSLRSSVPQFAGEPIYEDVEAEPVGNSLYELKAHALYIPLAPGDVVTASDHDDEGCFLVMPEVTGLASLTSLYTYDVDFEIAANLGLGIVLPEDDPARIKIAEVTEGWRREAWVTQHTTYSFYVSSQSAAWLEDRVVDCKYVEHIQQVRHPGMEIDFSVAVGNADLGDLTQGPWA